MHPFSDNSTIEQPLNIRLVEVIRELHLKGWTPATSSNFSYRNPKHPNVIFVSQSGIDKGKFQPNHFMQVDLAGNAISEGKPSAETLLHTLLYRLYHQAQCVLHTHAPATTVISCLKKADGQLTIKGLELLKALRGITTHEIIVRIPIVKNSQDIAQMAQELEQNQAEYPLDYGFLIEGHGLYVWGTSIEEAHRQLEALEFLFERILELERHGCFDYSR